MECLLRLFDEVSCVGNGDVQGRVFAWGAYKEEGETDKNEMTGCLLLCGIH